MRVVYIAVAIIATSWLPNVISQKHALFVRRDDIDSGKRVTRQTSADQMVQNILQWLQGVYTQNSRRIRQGQFREYLPPTNTQKPRPFQPPDEAQGSENNFIGYPPAGVTPQPTFPEYPPSTGGEYPKPGNEIYPPIDKPGNNGYEYPNKPEPGFPSPGEPGYPSKPFPTEPPPQTTGHPTTTHPIPEETTPHPGYPTHTTPQPGYPGTSEHPGFPTSEHPPQTFPTRPPPQTFPTRPPPQTFPTRPPPQTFPTRPPPSTSEHPGTFPTRPPPTYQTTHPTTHPPTYPTTPSPTYPPPTRPTYPSYGPSTDAPFTHLPLHPQTDAPESLVHTEASVAETEAPGHSTERPDETVEGSHPSQTIEPSPEDNNVDSDSKDTESNEDLKHPPHIHEIDVECAKDMMTINIEFNRQFDGIIYSKGFYSNPDCRYVQENSGKTKFSFTVSLNSCGTEFVNAFDTEGQSYLENVLVLQNEAGIQEVWDTIRAVRCLWEGNLNKALSVALSVGMLTQEIVTFSGDTAMAKLDIQLGKGPFAPVANGLVKIGDPMTLVVSVSGDPGFDIQVKDCRAKDSTGENVVGLTDDNGCVLKPKLFGAFQKTRSTGSTGASIIAYAFFNAFKFPDVMDLMIECNVELCKTDCEVCPDPNQKYEPGRRRKREIYNETLGEPVTMGKTLRVILPEDLSDGEAIINLRQREEICMSTQSFIFSAALLISLLTGSTLFSAHLWLKNQRLVLRKYQNQ